MSVVLEIKGTAQPDFAFIDKRGGAIRMVEWHDFPAR